MHLPAIAAVMMSESRSRDFDRARRDRALAIRQISTFRERASFLWELKSFVRESLLAVLVSLLIVTVAGALFGSLRDALIALPGLTLIVPGALAMRGNIYASLGARLGTALHTGELSSRTGGSPRLKEEILAVLVQTMIGALVLALAGRIIALAIGLETVSLVMLSVTAFLGALMAGAISLVVTIEVAISAHRKGWDPDNVTAPVISAVADLVSIPLLIGSALLVLHLPELVTGTLFALFLGFTILLVMVVARGHHERASQVLAASVPVLMAVLVVIIIPGLLLEDLVEDLVETPTILIMLPPFVAVAGNLGAILASRLSSAAHLGLITLRGAPDPLVYQNLGVIFLLSGLTFGALGVLVHAMAILMGMATPGLGLLLLISVAGGLAITAVTSLTAYRVTTYMVRKGDDPDNVVIPIITSTMDAVGTGLVVGLFILLVF